MLLNYRFKVLTLQVLYFSGHGVCKSVSLLNYRFKVLTLQVLYLRGYGV